jgi:zinc/manganese transport system substrate-binding protein
MKTIRSRFSAFLVTIVLTSMTLFSATAEAKVKVIATTTDVAALVRVVGGDAIELETIARGTQDPHFIETKPSYMVKFARADLVIANGLSLEVGWLPSLIRGARNPKIQPDSKGYLELGASIEPLDIPAGKVTRAMGDVHPDGNPHFTLDPVQMAKLAPVVAARLGDFDPASKAAFTARAEAFAKQTEEKMKVWQERAVRLAQKKVVTYHSSLTYFLKRFGLEARAYLEPKPGIPPSAAHILAVIDTMKKERIRTILVDNFFEPKIAERVAKDVPDARVEVVGIAVESKPELNSLADVTEQLISALERTQSK